jgi:hypothetical protein
MAGPKIIPKGCSFWGASVSASTVNGILAAYESGLAGAYSEPEETAALISQNKALTGFGSIGEAATSNAWADSGKGQLIFPWVFVMEQFPGCWPGPAQEVGDCVSHNQKNSSLLSMVCEVVAARPDEVSQLLEAIPHVTPAAIEQGVFSTEAIYWWRRHGGHGWSCGASSRVMQKESGLWIRQAYPDLGIDLTTYSGKQTERFGQTPPSGAIAAAGKSHLVRAYAEAASAEERRDALANGYGLSTCGSESFSRDRDANGVSIRTREGWAHALATIGFDDRPDTIKIYGDSLQLILNSWAKWNKGPRDVRDSAKLVPPAKKAAWIKCGAVNPQTGNLLIPEGAFWAKSRDVAQREVFAVSSVNGWPRRKLLDWGGSLAG